MEEGGNIVASSRPPKMVLMPPEEVSTPKLHLANLFKKGSKWTAERVRNDGPIRHPECSYHLVKDEHVNKGHKSTIPIWCTIHQEEFRMVINDHFDVRSNGNGCRKCSNRELWTTERVRKEGPILHPDCSYHLVKDEHITHGDKSIIPVWCNTHSEVCWPIINNHFSGHSKGCRKCSNRELWTAERVRKEGPLLNPDYKYSQVTVEHVTNGKNSIIPITCMTHNISFQTSIDNHFNHHTRSCPECYCPIIWTREKVQREGPLLHPEFIYSIVTDKDMADAGNSIIPVWCMIHNVLFLVNAKNHFYGNIKGCRKCSNCELWTTERVWIEGPRLHPEYGYYFVTDEHVKEGHMSIIPIWCTIHENLNHVRIHDHFSGNSRGCRKCSNCQLWTLERFLLEANLIHENTCDYSEIKEEDIVTSSSRVPIICKTCLQKWHPRISDHIYGETGCPPCNRKGYSKVAIEWLGYMAMKDNTHIQHAGNGGEYPIPGTLYHADGYSLALNKIYEYNGDYWHGNPAIYHPDEINEVRGETMGELFTKTKESLQKILELGYNLECIWGRDWRSMKKLHNQPKVITLTFKL